MENILREVVLSLGYERVVQLLEQYKPAPVVAVAPVVSIPEPVVSVKEPVVSIPEPVVSVKEPVSAPPKAEGKKNVSRLATVIVEKLSKKIKEIGVEFNEKNHKKQYVDFVNALDSKTYSLKKPEEHIADFVATLKPVEKKPVEPKELSLKELQATKTLTSPQGIKHGMYWETTQGVFVKGPSRDPDEYYVERTFNNQKYMVGENSGRVYSNVDEDDEQFEGSFLGFIGVGEFADYQ